MNVTRILQGLRTDRDALVEAIAALERVVSNSGRRPGRPSAWSPAARAAKIITAGHLQAHPGKPVPGKQERDTSGGAKSIDRNASERLKAISRTATDSAAWHAFVQDVLELPLSMLQGVQIAVKQKSWRLGGICSLPVELESRPRGK